MGEEDSELFEALRDLRAVQCDIVTIGQYLKPDAHKHRVSRYITPTQFKDYERYAKKIGFRFVSAGPLVRSSYNADDVFDAIRAEAVMR